MFSFVTRHIRLVALAAAVTAAAALVADSLRSISTAGPDRNIALNKPYTVTPPPSYTWSMGRRRTELTDGVRAEHSFWVNGQSVGWTWDSPAIVDIDLGSLRSVDHVRIQTGANLKVGIRYPAQFMVYGADVAGRFGLLGSTAPGHDRDDPADVQTRLVDIRFPPRQVTRIAVVAFARGTLMFISEIEAYASTSGKPFKGTLSSVRDVATAAIATRRARIAGLPGPHPTGPAPWSRWAMPIAQVTAGAPQADETAAAGLAVACTAHRIGPWHDMAGAPSSPQASRPADGANTGTLTALLGGRDYAAWQVFNATDREVNLRLEVEAGADVRVRTHALAYVQALNYQWRPDVVAPVPQATIPPRSAVTVIAEMSPVRPGRHVLPVTIECGGNRQQSTVELVALSPDRGTPAIHGNMWTYLHEPRHAPIARSIACSADFQSRHGIDTSIVHPGAVVDDGGRRPSALLRRYFKAYKDQRRILLFLDLKSRPWAYLKMQDGQAVEQLRTWWAWVSRLAQEEAVGAEILLYLADEPRPADVAQMAKFRELAARAEIRARTYATVDLPAVAARLSWIDVLQAQAPERTTDGLNVRGELHLYAADADARLASVSGYYRQQGWRAFLHGYSGVGIWSSWDGMGLTDPKSGWNPFGKDDRDFGHVYVSPDGCGWPSRRLLAWSRGIEENRILRQCAKKKPVEIVQAKVRKAISADGDGAMSAALAEIATACSAAGDLPGQ